MNHDIVLKKSHNTDAPSVAEQEASLEALHQHQADTAEDTDKVKRNAGGIHTAEVLGKHLETSHGPRWTGVKVGK